MSMTLIARCITLTMMLAFISACQNRGCDEFDPPPDRVPTHCAPAKSAASTTPVHKRYCYSTLGQPDCYDTPQPRIAPSFLGTYPN